MKKLFRKLYKIFLVLGIIALITMVLIITNATIINGMSGTVMLICLVIMMIVCVFVIVSIILAIIEGVKKDKVAFLKKFFSNLLWITLAYIVPYVLDYFYEVKVPIRFDIGKIVLRVLITNLALIGGEYMFADHSKES